MHESEEHACHHQRCPEHTDRRACDCDADVATFVQWVDAYARDDEELQAFYLARFREEFKPVVEAWIAERPLKIARVATGADAAAAASLG